MIRYIKVNSNTDGPSMYKYTGVMRYPCGYNTSPSTKQYKDAAQDHHTDTIKTNTSI